MSNPLFSLTASVLEAAAARIAQPVAWPDLDSGFTYSLLHASHLPVPTAYDVELRAAAPHTLRRSPELGAFGYVLSRANPELQGDWAQAFGRLTGREVFPADRNAFIYNPLELLGIALGAMQCSAVTAGQRRWLADNIRRGLVERQFTEPIAEITARCALRAISGNDERCSLARTLKRPVTEFATPDLCLATGLAILFPREAAVDIAAAERELACRALREPLEVREGAEVCGLYVALRRAVDRVMREPGLDGNAVARVVALCRRFQLFVDPLQRRKRNRASFVVTDEYDVQDLLHSVLRLHFDDVRPEECTPSYAGKSSRVDFYLPRERTVVEAKMTRVGLGQKEVSDELIIDKERYAKMARVDDLVCFVYDPDRICPNPAALENDLEQSGAPLRVAVVVCPSGT